MKMFRLRLIAIAAVMALSVGFLATLPSARAQDSTPANEFPVNIRFLNAMTTVGAIDVYINSDEKEQRVAEGLEYGVVSDAYQGTSPVTAVIVKQNVNNGFDRYLYEVVVPTAAGKEYLVVVSDLLVIPTEMDLSPVDSGQARIRAINAAPQSPSLDFYLSTGDGTPVVADGSPTAADGSPTAAGGPVVENLRFGQATDAGTVAAGSYDVSATATGTDTLAVESSGLAIDAGQSYTLVVIGAPGDSDTPLMILPVSAATTT